MSRSCGFGNIGVRHYAVPVLFHNKLLSYIHRLFCPRFGKREEEWVRVEYYIFGRLRQLCVPVWIL